MPGTIATRVYDLYGRFYDGFEVLFKKRLAFALTRMPLRPGDTVLDIGIGTGLSLEFYPGFAKVVGVDLSEGMLHQARRKVESGEVRTDASPHDTHLLQANALDLPFGDESFDAVFVSHVVSVVPNPHQCMREAFRVARDRAPIVLVNHFRSPYPVISWLETAVDPICRKLGWRSDLSLRELLEPLGVGQLNNRAAVRGNMFQIVFMQKVGASVRLVAIPPQPVFKPSEATL